MRIVRNNMLSHIVKYLALLDVKWNKSPHARRHFTCRRQISRTKCISQIPKGIYFVAQCHCGHCAKIPCPFFLTRTDLIKDTKVIIFLSNSQASLTNRVKCGTMFTLHKLHIFSLIRENTLVKSVFSLFSYRIGESLCSNIRGKHFFGAFLRGCTFLYADEGDIWTRIFQER